MYKYAAQHGLRYPSVRGQLTTEQIFALPLKSATGFDLDSTARTINNELKGLSEESFVDTGSDPRKKELQFALDIVKDVISTKQALNAANLAKATKAAERKKILDALGAKKDEAISQASVEELEKKLAALEEA